MERDNLSYLDILSQQDSIFLQEQKISKHNYDILVLILYVHTTYANALPGGGCG
jgi:hypothetical protein